MWLYSSCIRKFWCNSDLTSLTLFILCGRVVSSSNLTFCDAVGWTGPGSKTSPIVPLGQVTLWTSVPHLWNGDNNCWCEDWILGCGEDEMRSCLLCSYCTARHWVNFLMEVNFLPSWASWGALLGNPCTGLSKTVHSLQNGVLSIHNQVFKIIRRDCFSFTWIAIC